MNKLKYGFLPLFMSFFLLLVAKAQIPQLKYETRAVWLTTLSGMDWPKAKAVSAQGRERQKQELRDILDKYQQLHLNTVLLQTRVRGTMIYPSALEGWDPSLTGQAGKDPGYDPLQFAIEECHKRGMELHCWMVTIPSGNAKVHKQLGSKTVTKSHPQIAKRIKDYWYLDPGNPTTKDYLASLCEEITRKYDIDGIHFDFIRYPENSADAVDRESFRKFGKGQDKASWRRNNITECVKAMYKTIKSIKPWVKVTCAPLGKYRDTDRFSSTGWNGYNKVFQESQKWVKEGYMDGLYPMLYYRGNHFYPFVHDWIENNNGRPVIPGLGIYFLHPSEGNWVLSDVQRQMNYSRSLGLGVAHYRSKFLTDNTKGLFDWCKKMFYPYPALTPPLSWIYTESPKLPTGLKITKNGSANVLSWNALPDEQTHTYVTYNVYRSLASKVDINQPKNLIAARLIGTTFTDETAEGKAYNYVITAVNRYGIESQIQQTGSPVQTTSDSMKYNAGKLRFTEQFQAKSILISDIYGRSIKEFPYSQEINVSELKPGSYSVTLIKKDGHKKVLGVFLK